MRIVATSDWHGLLPDLPKCDVLLLVGDILPDFFPQPLNVRKNLQRQWFYDKVVPHVMGIATHTVGTWGNHDFWGQDVGSVKILDKDHRQVSILVDEPTVVYDETGTRTLQLYGFPWVTNLPRWAFNIAENLMYEKLTHYVPRTADLLLAHAPPLYFGDQLARETKYGKSYGGEHVGSKPLYKWITHGHGPMPMVISGHIHEGFGSYLDNKIHNVAYVDEYYEPQSRWLELTYDKEGLRVDRWSGEGGSGAVATEGSERESGGSVDDGEPSSGSEVEAAESKV